MWPEDSSGRHLPPMMMVFFHSASSSSTAPTSSSSLLLHPPDAGGDRRFHETILATAAALTPMPLRLASSCGLLLPAPAPAPLSWCSCGAGARDDRRCFRGLAFLPLVQRETTIAATATTTATIRRAEAAGAPAWTNAAAGSALGWSRVLAMAGPSCARTHQALFFCKTELRSWPVRVCSICWQRHCAIRPSVLWRNTSPCETTHDDRLRLRRRQVRSSPETRSSQ
jgi:hypothetical protein